jgi:hypothetical protein
MQMVFLDQPVEFANQKRKVFTISKLSNENQGWRKG